MFLAQPLIDVLMGRGIEDIDGFLKTPSWSDLPDPASIPSMKEAADRVYHAVREGKRIAIFGDYDCDGVCATQILRSVLRSFGVSARAYLPHRDEGYGLSSPAVHQFSQGGTDLLITVDNGINARAAILLAQRLGIDVLVIDHHRIQDQAQTLAVWSPEFCGAGLAVMFSWALALRAGWEDARIERLVLGCSQYATIASIADCVPLLGATRMLAKLGLAQLPKTRHLGLQELLNISCADPARPDSHDVAFGLAPRINAAGRMDHPALALAVFEAVQNQEAARERVDTLNQLNLERRRIVKFQFEELASSVVEPVPAALVIYRDSCPKGIAGLLASKCVERFSVPTIVLVPSTTPGQVIGSGRSVAAFDLVEGLRPFEKFFIRFGGHAQAAGLTMPLDQIGAFEREFALSVEKLGVRCRPGVRHEAELALSTIGKRFYEQLALLEPFGEGNRAPVFLVRLAEVFSAKNRWVRIRQGRSSIEVLSWGISVDEGMKGDCLIEFHGKTRILRGFAPHKV
jgi:single-stranded-DNA-specific exonuclease